MLTIYDGRSHFWQWDIGQKLKIDSGQACEVHFQNRNGATAFVVETYAIDGQTLADVPNIILQDDNSVLAWVYICEGDECTKHEARFEVWPRQRPADYVYTETEVKTYSALEERIKNLEEKEIPQAFKWLGDNPIASTAEDTPAKWSELGTGYARFTSKIMDKQPGTYGMLLNFSHSGTTFQLYHITNAGPAYIRSGNLSSGWDSKGWRKLTEGTNSGVTIDPMDGPANVSVERVKSIEVKEIFDDPKYPNGGCELTFHIVPAEGEEYTHTAKIKYPPEVDDTLTKSGAAADAAKVGEELGKKANDKDLHAVAKSGSYNDLENKPTIPVVPSKVTAFENDAGYLTKHQDISGKLDANKLPDAINAALAQAKESGVFDGKPGYTPQKDVDYFDGAPGVPGEPGKTPEKGVDYWTAEDKTGIVSDVLAALPTWTGGDF